ncbi:MAG: DUF5989 family protein [Planctomycetota bacterium]
MENRPSDNFEEAAEGSDPSLLREFIDFLRFYKKWWLAPILLVTALLIVLALLASSPAAPFIYSVF